MASYNIGRKQKLTPISSSHHLMQPTILRTFRVLSTFISSFILLLGAPVALSQEVPNDVASAYRNIPRLRDAKGGRCYIRAAVVHHQLRDVLPPDSLGNVFIFYGTDKKPADETIAERAFHVSPDSRNWFYHVAPLYIDAQGRPWVLEVSPWVHRPLPLNDWLAFNILNFDKKPCEKVDLLNQSDRLESQSIYCKVAITPPRFLARGDTDNPELTQWFNKQNDLERDYLKHLGRVVPKRRVRREVYESFQSPDWSQYLNDAGRIQNGRLQRFIESFLKSDSFNFEP
jgi:hypothetical protein